MPAEPLVLPGAAELVEPLVCPEPEARPPVAPELVPLACGELVEVELLDLDLKVSQAVRASADAAMTGTISRLRYDIAVSK